MFTKRYWRIWLNILLIVWVHINCQHLKLYQHQTYFHVFSHTYDSWQLSHGGENESVAPHAASQSLAVGGRSRFKGTLFFHILFRLTSSGSGKKILSIFFVFSSWNCVRMLLASPDGMEIVQYDIHCTPSNLLQLSLFSVFQVNTTEF